MTVLPGRAKVGWGQPADQKQPDKSETVKHRRLVRDRALIKRRRPVKDLDRRWDRHDQREQRKDQARVIRLAADEHMVAPYQKTDHGDRDTGKGDKDVSEN